MVSCISILLDFALKPSTDALEVCGYMYSGSDVFLPFRILAGIKNRIHGMYYIETTKHSNMSKPCEVISFQYTHPG